MSLHGIFDPVVRAYFKNLYGGGESEATLASVIDRSVTSVIIPAGVKKIADYAFCSCNKLSSVSFNDDVTEIGTYSFSGCSTKEIVFPESLQIFGTSAFFSAPLRNILFPASVRSIGSAAFRSNYALVTITFEGTPDSIAADSFSSTSELKTINVPWAEGAVANAPWGATNATINYNYTGE